jgi:EmrB/QacA subfamily drug resistance transporter
MAVMDGIVVSIALPTITAFYGVDVAQSQWVITAYLMTVTALFLVFGRVAESVGKSRLFLAGMALFTLASFGCASAPNLLVLIGMRVLQAIGASAAFAISTAIIYGIFPRGEQGRAMGAVAATVSVAGLSAPALGGFLTQLFGWEYIFLINIPAGIALLAVGLRVMDLHEPRHASLSMDWTGAVTLMAAIVAFMLCLEEFTASISISAPLGLAALGAFTLFVRTERRHSRPLVDFSLLKNPLFAIPLASCLLFFVALFSYNICGPFYFEGVMGLSPAEVGGIFMIVPSITVVASPLTGWLFDRRESPAYAGIGLSLCTLALILLAWGAVGQNFLLILASLVVLAFGNALFSSPNNTEIMRAAPVEKMGLASSLTAMARNFGMALGVSVAGILLTFQVGLAGTESGVASADPALLAGAISVVLLVAALTCAIGVAVQVLRWRMLTRGQGRPAQP